MSVATGRQMDMLDLIAEELAGEPGPCLYGSPSRGLGAREAEFDAWRRRHGNFGSIPRSHAWHLMASAPSARTNACQPTVLCADARQPAAGCSCAADTGDLMHRGACTGCDWEGEPRHRENPAAEDACDHAHPGWRTLPVAPALPNAMSPAGLGKATARWLDRVAGQYPAGWLESGGPVRTLRLPPGNRHVPARTPFGGYDLAAGPADLPRSLVIELAGVVDLDHNCITACCLAHHQAIFTGGIDRDWLHSTRYPCAEIPPGVPARAEPDPVAVRKPARPREQAARDPKTPARKSRPAAEVVRVDGDLL